MARGCSGEVMQHICQFIYLMYLKKIQPNRLFVARSSLHVRVDPLCQLHYQRTLSASCSGDIDLVSLCAKITHQVSPGLQNKLDFQNAFIFGSKGGSDIDRLVSRNPDRTPLLSSGLSPISCQFY